MANREYKSDVFSMLLEDSARALDVYNAMAAYTDPEIIEIHTLERGEDVQKSMMFDLTYEKQMENAKQACGFQVKDAIFG